MYRNLALCAALLCCLILPGCGGGGSAGSNAATAKAVTKVQTAGLLPGGEVLGAIRITLGLPYGVTVALDPATGLPAANVVQLVGAADPTLVFQQVHYLAPTPTARGSLSFVVVNAQGFGALEYLAVQLDITPGYFPAAGDFTVSDFAVAGISNYQETTISNPTLSVEIK
ncbi:hypothetical protein GMLC_15730 [Geomonas limicola]|uniref:Lipoprotein n=1 Tax=Geomonas limicola TaxID=2740186 RepID=A0A6V8N7S0_9BACT|nr:hypothetical protein [Geomonas limicola]GFO67994.1 hypothetical protein GMLC_15730 [Geomonas limicola]